MIYSIHWFRGVAILFVVLSHIPLDDLTDDSFGRLFGAIVKNGTLLFVFISGFLFFHLREKFNLKKFYFSKVKNVILPYALILTSVMLVILVFKYFGLTYFNENIDITSPFRQGGIVWHLLVGGALIDALWYIPMAVIFFVISPLIIVAQDSTKFLVSLTAVALFCSITSFRPLPNVFPLYSFSHFLGIYLAGCLTSKYFTFIIKYHLRIFCVAFCTFVTLLCFHNFQPNYRWSWYYGDTPLSLNILQMQKLAFTFSVITFFTFLERRNIEIKALNLFADFSFGIFFLHGILIYILRKLPILTQIEHPYLKYWIFAFLVLCISASLVGLIKKIAGQYSRFVIGC